MIKYEPAKIEPKWQKKWAQEKLQKVDLKKPKKKYYLLVEFTYPSGDLHMGHWFAFAVPDILARMKRMQGYSVFAPNGFDAFGLPAENAAISRGVHPSDWTHSNIKRMKQQFATMGATYDWDHKVITCDAEYYRWNQWIFLKMFEKGLAYRGRASANWCPKDQCVLANENVENGKCWRCGTEVVQKEVEQWFLKITDYAERLIWSDHEPGSKNSSEPGSEKVEGPERSRRVDWPKSLRDGQNNWIGKSEGTVIEFRVKSLESRIEVFTTRVDTLFGATFLVIAPEHPILAKIVPKNYSKAVKAYQSISAKKSQLERQEMREKTGVFTGVYAINPVNNEQIPIWIADYALMGYGTGALFGDAHDERDVEFAKRYKIPLKPTLITGDAQRDGRIKNLEEVFTGEGILFDSGEFSGLKSAEARSKITAWLKGRGDGRAEIVYHLHDWSISRQRYWGTPIPIIYCDKCGTVPVPENDLPVELPYKVDYAPKGKPPLATAEDWVRVKCPNCGGEARREVETMDTFVDSSWYFLRYLRKIKYQIAKFPKGSANIKNEELPWDQDYVRNWMPMDIYFGGAEHTLGHTLYSRFFVKFLQDVGVVPPMPEYARKRVHHGVILGPDGQRMSKSHGNVVNPDDEVKQYGADAVRMYLAFLGPYDLVAPWNPGGIGGVYNFLQRVWKLFEKVDGSLGDLVVRPEPKNPKTQHSNNLPDEDLQIMHKTIKKVTEDIEEIKFNTAIAALMEWLNYLSGKVHRSSLREVLLRKMVSREEAKVQKISMNDTRLMIYEYKTFLLLLAPFAPHMCEELWQQLKGTTSGQSTTHSASSGQASTKGKENQKARDTRDTLEARDTLESIHQQPWPAYDPKLAQAKTITLVIQVNGKLRERLLVEAGISQKDVEQLALNSPRVQKFLGSRRPQKVIFVLDRLINFVV